MTSKISDLNMMAGLRNITIAGLIVFLTFAHMQARAAIVEYELSIARQEVYITGKPRLAITINGGIPGPTLRFRQGDIARIHVHNKMAEATSIHWHGVLVPPGMDGVPYLSFPPIEPGKTFTYEFPIRQSGTYWYHSHSGLQEQSGMYGSIVIEQQKSRHTSDRDYVVILSDWTDEDPHNVNRTLKSGSEWYALEKGSAQSIFGAARLGMLGDYAMRELQRMPAMDIADIAYDRFLANGTPESSLPAKPNETVRLRIINGSATTYFFVEFAGGPMAIIAADGLDVKRVAENRFLIAVAETYDVLVQIPGTGSYEFRATAHDGSGYASVWIGSGSRHPVPDVPRPNLYHSMGGHGLKQIFALTPAGAMGMSDRDVEAGMFDQPGMMDMRHMETDEMPGMSHGESMSMSDRQEHTGHDSVNKKEGASHMAHDEHAAMKGEESHETRGGKRYGRNFGLLAADVSSSTNLAMDGMDKERPWPPYSRLRALKPSAFPENKPVREVRLTLDGDMERYVWFINNRPLSESDSILIKEGEVVRFIMINRTMMHHPMHLHGHFFRVINGQGDYSPLKHTVDVAPMSTTVIEFDANEVGDWFFHCHLLYHMKAGMARVIHYDGFTLDPQLQSVRPKLYKDPLYFYGWADVLSNMSEGSLVLSNSLDILRAQWEVGWQDVDHTESEFIFTYDRYINRFFTLFVGGNLLFDEDDDETRLVAGFHYLLPLNLESRVWVDTDGGARVNVEKTFDLTPRTALNGEVQYDSHDKWEGSVDISYLVHKNFSLVGKWHAEYGFGGGVQIRF